VQHVFRLFALVAFVPAVDLERAVAHLVAALSEIGERFLAGQPTAAVAVIGAGVGGQALAITAEQLRHRAIQLLAREIPKRDVERPVSHMIELARLTFQVVVDELALLSLAAQQIGCEHERLPERRTGSHPMRHIFAAQTVLGHDRDRVLADLSLGAFLVSKRADTLAAHRAEINGIELEHVNFNAIDLAHAPLLAQ
jgi:hypothetical protein